MSVYSQLDLYGLVDELGNTQGWSSIEKVAFFGSLLKAAPTLGKVPPVTAAVKPLSKLTPSTFSKLSPAAQAEARSSGRFIEAVPKVPKADTMFTGGITPPSAESINAARERHLGASLAPGWAPTGVRPQQRL